MISHKKFVDGIIESGIEEKIFVKDNGFGQNLFHEFGIYLFEVFFLPIGNTFDLFHLPQILKQVGILPKFFNVIDFQRVLQILLELFQKLIKVF